MLEINNKNKEMIKNKLMEKFYSEYNLNDWMDKNLINIDMVYQIMSKNSKYTVDDLIEVVESMSLI